MGFYSNRTIGSGETVFDIDHIVADPRDFSENFMESGVLIAMEAEKNWNSIMQAIALDEINALAEGTEVDYLNEAGTGFFAKVKEVLKKLLEKVKGLFNSFIAMINKWTMSDKEFVKKYQNAIITGHSKAPSSWSIKGFKFTNLDSGKGTYLTANLVYSVAQYSGVNLSNPKSVIGLDKSKREDIIKAIRDDRTECEDKLRADTLGSSSNITASEYSKELFEFFRDGDSSKQSFDKSDINVTEQIRFISNTADMKKAAEKQLKDVNKAISDTIKEVDKIEKDINTAVKSLKDGDEKDAHDDALTIYAVVSSLLSTSQTINTQFNAAYLSALKDRNRQARAICARCVAFNNGVGVKKESAELGGNSVLSSVALI